MKQRVLSKTTLFHPLFIKKNLQCEDRTDRGKRKENREKENREKKGKKR
jgi:hypothetical protein